MDKCTNNYITARHPQVQGFHRKMRVTPVCAGLGDIAVPGLLACLALRFDASRSIDIRARAEAAGLALQSSLDALVSTFEQAPVKNMSNLTSVVESRKAMVDCCCRHSTQLHSNWICLADMIVSASLSCSVCTCRQQTMKRPRPRRSLQRTHTTALQMHRRRCWLVRGGLRSSNDASDQVEMKSHMSPH